MMSGAGVPPVCIKCVRPLPSAGFPHAAALGPAGPPSWNKSLRHSRGASAF